ncbi:MAG: chromate resistance protein ChrB domain-containing protein, partial [Candidatus Rokuibacteriota bacterium]
LKIKLQALRRELDRIQGIDYLETPLGAKARKLWESVATRARALEARPAVPGRRRSALPPAGSTWVTRPRPHIDRIASAWLIKRFVDDQARFAFADPADASRKGIPFDILGAEFGHQGDDCTFETLVKRFGLKDRRLKALAEIVHEADLRDGKFARPEATGVDLTLKGLAATTHDDHELLDRGMAVLDGLYATLKQRA